jgi:hypothetical protein
MSPHESLRRSLLAGGLLLVGGCAAVEAVAPPPGPVPAPRVRVGDRWRYQRINRYNGLSTGVLTMRVASVAPQLVVRVTDETGAALPDEVYDRPWRVLQEPHYDLVQVFAQPQPVLPARLEAGAQASTRNDYRVAGLDRPLFWTEDIHAVAWERVHVPAGDFDALRIRRAVWCQHMDWSRSMTRRTETLWYAPSVNRWVQREWTGEYRAGGRGAVFREDWVAWRLLDYTPVAG